MDGTKGLAKGKMKQIGICIEIADWIPDEMSERFVEILSSNVGFKDAVEEAMHEAFDTMDYLGGASLAHVEVKDCLPDGIEVMH